MEETLNQDLSFGSRGSERLVSSHGCRRSLMCPGWREEDVGGRSDTNTSSTEVRSKRRHKGLGTGFRDGRQRHTNHMCASIRTSNTHGSKVLSFWVYSLSTTLRGSLNFLPEVRVCQTGHLSGLTPVLVAMEKSSFYT